jgi:putative membrane protein
MITVRLPLAAAAFVAGVTGAFGPLAEAAHHDFTAHVVAHLLLGMVAPLLLCLAAPVTFLLRALPQPVARRLGRFLSKAPVRVLTEPVVAAALNVGGLWLLYTSGLFAAMHSNPALHAVVHLHMAIAGYLFTVSIIGVDPMPHRRTYPYRAAVLVAAVAAHDILAKVIYAHPPAGVDPTQVTSAAMIMYYGGDAVSIIVMIILCARWIRDPRRIPFNELGQARTS